MLYTLILTINILFPLTNHHTSSLTVVFNETSKLSDGMPKLELYRSYT